MGVLRRRVMRSAETRDVVGGSTDGGCKSQEAISTLMSRSPRLETNSGSNSSTLPPTAYHPSLMLASTELGVYIKWALLLQEQLEHVQAERAGLAQHCSRLQVEEMLAMHRGVHGAASVGLGGRGVLWGAAHLAA